MKNQQTDDAAAMARVPPPPTGSENDAVRWRTICVRLEAEILELKRERDGWKKTALEYSSLLSNAGML